MTESEWCKSERVRQINHLLKQEWFLLHQEDTVGPVRPDLIFSDKPPDKRPKTFIIMEIVDTYLSSEWGVDNSSQRDATLKLVEMALKERYPSLDSVTLKIITSPSSHHYRITYRKETSFLNVDDRVWTSPESMGSVSMQSVRPGDIIWCYVSKIGMIQKRKVIAPGYFKFDDQGTKSPAIKTKVINDFHQSPIPTRKISEIGIQVRGTFSALSIEQAHNLNRELELIL